VISNPLKIGTLTQPTVVVSVFRKISCVILSFKNLLTLWYAPFDKINQINMVNLINACNNVSNSVSKDNSLDSDPEEEGNNLGNSLQISHEKLKTVNQHQGKADSNGVNQEDAEENLSSILQEELIHLVGPLMYLSIDNLLVL